MIGYPKQNYYLAYMYRRNTPYLMPRTRKKIATCKRMVHSSPTQENCKQKANIPVIKLTLMIPPRHNGVIIMEIKGHVMKGH